MTYQQRNRVFAIFTFLLLLIISSVNAQDWPEPPPEFERPLTYLGNTARGLRELPPPPGNDLIGAAVTIPDVSGGAYTSPTIDVSGATILTDVDGVPLEPMFEYEQVYEDEAETILLGTNGKVLCLAYSNQYRPLSVLGTVWYRYDVPAGSDQHLTIDLTASDFEGTLEVFDGAPAGIDTAAVACNDESTFGAGTPLLYNFVAGAGKTYYFRIANEGTVLDPPPAQNLEIRVYLTPAAGNFAVNTFNDTVDANPGNGTCADGSGDCSLRAAVMEANASQTGSQITIPAGTYNLTIANPVPYSVDENLSESGDLDIITEMTITGDTTNPTSTVISTALSDRIFHIVDANHDYPLVTIEGVTIQGGAIDENTSSAQSRELLKAGGAILVQHHRAQLTLNSAYITGNRAQLGGGIAVSSSYAIITNSVLLNNAAVEPTTADSLDTTIENGGGLYIEKNTNMPSSPAASINSEVTLKNVTISDNKAVRGAGIYMAASQFLTTNNVTIADNGVTGEVVSGKTLTTVQGGGLFTNFPSSVQTELENSVLVLNTATSDADCKGAFTSNGFNVLSSNVCGFDATDTITPTPAIDPVATVYGTDVTPLPGHMLWADRGGLDTASTTCETTDQRGVARPQGAGCDSGALEARGEVPNTPVLIAPIEKTFTPATAMPAPLAQSIDFKWYTVTNNTPADTTYNFTLAKADGSVLLSATRAHNDCVVPDPVDAEGRLECTFTAPANTITSFGDYEWSVRAKFETSSLAAKTTLFYAPLNLLKNSGFENGVSTSPAIPVKWTPKNRTKDARLANSLTRPSHTGGFAYYFRGSANENSILIQTYTFPTRASQARKGYLLNLSGWIRTGTSGRGALMLQAIYTDGTVSKVKKIGFANVLNNGTDYRNIATTMTAGKRVAKLKVTIKNTSLSGIVGIDTMKLWVEIPVVARDVESTTAETEDWPILP